MQKANTTALLLAIVLGAAAAGCAPTEANGEQSNSITTNNLPMTADAGVTLPAGVLPPNNPPEPGVAPIGADGHYNYDAPEFVLTNPCDDPEIMGRLEKIGFREQDAFDTRFQEVRHTGCDIKTKDDNDYAVYRASVAHTQLGNYGSEPQSHKAGNVSWVTFEQSNPIGLTACLASIESPKGSFGVMVDTTMHSGNDACEPVNKLMHDYLGEMS